MAWLTGWNYRKSHLIVHAANAGTLYQTCIKVYKVGTANGTETIGGVTAGKVSCDSHCRNDFGDIRFTDDTGNTLIDCWMESYVSGTSAIFWVEVAGDLSTVDKTIYVYYSKSDATYPYLATDLAQGVATFIFFDNFADGSIDSNKWTAVSGTIVESGGYLTLSGVNSKERSKGTLPTSLRLKFNLRSSATNGSDYGLQKSDNAEYSIFQSGAGQILDYYTAEDKTAWTAPSANVFHLYELRWIANTSSSYYVDNGSQIVNHTTHIPVNVTLFEMEGGYSVNPTLDLDWIFVSKYQATEPAHDTWGIEEQPTLPSNKIFVIDKDNNVFRIDLSGLVEEKKLVVT
jgi:hypothetical protein